MTQGSTGGAEERERAALGALRRELSPSAERTEAIWTTLSLAGLGVTLGGAQAGEEQAGGPASGPPRSDELERAAARGGEAAETLSSGGLLGASGALKAAVATGIVGTVLGFGAGYWAGERGAAPEALSRQEAAHVEAPVTSPPPVFSSAPASVAGPANEAPVAAASATGARHVGAPAASAAEPTFYEELSYLRRAQGALRDGNATLALGLMKELDELQPRGALSVERGVTRVLALCQLGRVEEASKSAHTLIKAFPASPYGARLQKSCVDFGEK